MKGHAIRSRSQWLHDGEKPTKFFCNLENKHYVEKTIKKLILPDGTEINEQKDILNAVRDFYKNLFSNKDENLDTTTNLDELLKDVKDKKKLTPTEAAVLEGELTVDELGATLKNMKNDKTPGLDGFPAEFFKFFWIKLKHFITRALNFSYNKGEFSISLTRCIITCLPKGDKPREYLKNWRPLSMLSVLYKIASSALAHRMKKVLDRLISMTQTGFLSGRNISESTRLVYDLMHITEKNNIPGMLMLIDFEKAFDSISWSFMYKVLEYFKFGPGFIKWIKVLNTNITASVNQCGILSSPFSIGRGARQGDPIAAYEFILCAEILYLLIANNPYIRGINIGGFEIKLTQFADDTTLFLDGSDDSLKAALNTLEVFGTLSGLRINTTKTQVIWIGSKKHSKEKCKTKCKLEWGNTEFRLLGLDFNVDLCRMIAINYDKAID